jgi:LysR family transcriptional activator of nhaA
MARGLNYNHLHYFWVVASEGHLTRAAGRLNLSQSALSTQIKTLEEQFGHLLFERRGRRLVLTEAGQIAFDYADAIFSAGEQLIGTLKAAGSAGRTSLRIGALATLSRNFQMAFLAPVLRDPNFALATRSGSLSELMADLEAHRLDIVLVNQEPLRTSGSVWIAHRVAQQSVSLVGHPRRIGAEQDYAALMKRHPLILPARESGVRSGFDALAMRLRIRPSVAAEVDDMAMMRVLVREDVGLAVLPPIVVRDELRNGDLIEAATLPGIAETFSAITLQRRFPNRLVERLIATPGLAGENAADETFGHHAQDVPEKPPGGAASAPSGLARAPIRGTLPP